MELTKELTEQTAEILTFDEISSSGEACSFIDLENGWGLKCYYDNKDDRDCSYTCQKYLANHELAPQVGKKFELIDHNGDTWFCFVTQVAKTLVDYGICNSHAFCEDTDLDSEDYRADEYDAMYCRNERDEWIHEVKSLTGFYYADDHAGNWGWIETSKGRRLVSIDFNMCFDLEEKILKGEV